MLICFGRLPWCAERIFYMSDLSRYGIDPSKGRKYENIVYVMALVYEEYMDIMSKYLSKYGLSPAKFNLLIVVQYQGGNNGISQVAISERLIVSAGNITGLVERLVKEGLLTRRQNPRSRRENIIKTTPKAAKLIEDLWPGYDALVKKLTDIIPAKDRPHFAKTLENWFEGIKKSG